VSLSCWYSSTGPCKIQKISQQQFLIVGCILNCSPYHRSGSMSWPYCRSISEGSTLILLATLQGLADNWTFALLFLCELLQSMPPRPYDSLDCGRTMTDWPPHQQSPVCHSESWHGLIQWCDQQWTGKSSFIFCIRYTCATLSEPVSLLWQCTVTTMCRKSYIDVSTVHQIAQLHAVFYGTSVQWPYEHCHHIVTANHSRLKLQDSFKCVCLQLPMLPIK
jgi:hypothetical protein